ncbi:MAG: hypothetical protein RMK29_07050 [Myxococcales bacterium]|nr:hypothetical protein [Myxococcota bacterium]MDW8281451.1 hypothetical protein [Myxococcales bacterium]
MKVTPLLAGLAFVVLGCAAPGTDLTDEERNQDVTAPGGMMDNVDYPKGNIGFSVGQQIANLSFLWYRNGLADIGQEPQKVRLSDIYAMRTQGARLLMLSGAAEWCEPCKAEADALVRVLKNPDFLSYLAGKGNPLVVVQVLLQQQDGSPSDRDALVRWVRSHKIDNFSVGIDPLDQVGQYTPANFLPRNLYIRISDMTLMAQEPGAPSMDDALIAKLKGFIERVAK